MKNYLMIFGFVLITIAVNAQITLRYETHGLQPDYKHQTQTIENVTEGLAGANVIWDFSRASCGKPRSSEITDAFFSKSGLKIEGTNLVIKDRDSDNEFFFSINEKRNEYYGYTTKDAVITLEKPILKMKYPFTYGNKETGDFYGSGLHYGTVITSISGTYSVEADGYGSLILPNSVVLDNVLRVRTEEIFYETSCNTIIIKNIKYLWFSADYRYPVFVVASSEVKQNGETKFVKNGYYNEKAVQLKTNQALVENSELQLNLYPNPFNEVINISYNLPQSEKVLVQLFSNNGSKICDLVPEQKQNGLNMVELKAADYNLATGNYLVKFIFGNKTIVRKISLVY